MNQRLEPPPNGATIRMYRQGLGDCFLLAFRGDGDKPVYMLIDCGVHTAQGADGTTKIRAIADDIAIATGGRIDVLVATHEHADHLSGFLTAAPVFDGITIGQLWLGWTEDREDRVANNLRKKHGHTVKVIQAALKKLRAKSKPAARDRTLERVTGLFGFFGAAEHTLSTDPEDVSGPEKALEYLQGKAASVTTFRPGGATVDVPGAGGIRVFVLGPPTDEKLLGQEEAFAHQGGEAFLTGLSLSEETAFGVAVLGDDPGSLNAEERELYELSFPFDGSHRKDLSGGKKEDSFLLTHYAEREAWRQIDDDWLRPAAMLALKLDRGTNNTSLALAIQLRRTKKVLLFPGDSQVGAWLSWSSHRWHADDDMEITSDELLRRTVFYKVGHHASHNGTVKESGLDKMGDDLIAMIPVHKKTSDKLKGWHMPHERLYKLLKAKTRGRVLRADEDPSRVKPSGVTDAQWGPFKDLVVDPLYFQLTIRD